MRTELFVTPENIYSKAKDWLDILEPFGRTGRKLVLKPESCALVVVDMLRYFAHPEGRAYLPSTAAVIPVIERLLGKWREIGGTVVFTRHCHRGPRDLGMLGKFFRDYIRCDERDSRIIGELTPLPSEKVVLKNTYDAFFHTGLDEYLSRRGVGQVLVTGVLTQMCCETTARSAFVRGYEVYVPVDALTTSTEELHIGSLRSLASGVAVMTSADEACGG